MHSRFALALAATTSIIPLATPAFAQDAETEIIIVTAQKREEALMEVPAAVSVISGAQLEASGSSSLQDYAAYIPGLNFASGGSPGQSQLTLRGVSPMGPNATVGTYIDDAPLGSSTFHARASLFALDLFPYDIERIEVVRGPQGTLYGASAVGGILKYVTRQPDPSGFSARLGGDIRVINEGGDDSYGVRGAVNVPLSQNFAVSLSGYDQHTAGYIDNTNTGRENTNELDQTGGRLAALWEITPHATLQFSAMIQDTDSADNNAAWYDFFSSQPLAGDLQSQWDLESPFSQQMRFYSLNGSFDLGWADLVSVSSYSTTDTFQFQDAPDLKLLVPALLGDPSAEGLTPFTLRLGLEKFTQEIRLASTQEDGIQWLVGLYYDTETSSNDQTINVLDTNQAPIPGLDPFVVASIPYEYQEIAAFANVTIPFNDVFDIALGARWAHNEDTFRQDIVQLGSPTSFTGLSEEDVTTYSVTPRLRVSDNLMIYGRYATGYRPGGPNVALPGIPPTVGADTLDSYELGVKAQIGSILTIEAAAYQSNWDNIQTATGGGGASWLVNSDGAEVAGLEFAAVLSPTDNFHLGANLAYTDASFTTDSPAVGAASGDALPQVPEWQGALTADYDHPLSNGAVLTLHAGYRYVGDEAVYDPLYGASTIPNYDLLDLRAGLSFDDWDLHLFANNVFDERAVLGKALHYDQVIAGTPLFSSANMAQPRTIGFSIDRRF